MKNRRTDAEIVRAIDRVSAEGPVPLAELAGERLVIGGVTIRPTAAVLLRWGQQGRNGVYLDVCYVKRVAGWTSSRAALGRFVRQLEERAAEFTRV